MGVSPLGDKWTHLAGDATVPPRVMEMIQGMEGETISLMEDGMVQGTEGMMILTISSEYVSVTKIQVFFVSR